MEERENRNRLHKVRREDRGREVSGEEEEERRRERRQE